MPRRIALMLTLALAAFLSSTMAEAQGRIGRKDACLERCLAGALDSADPRYRACVRRNCQGTASRTPRKAATAPAAPAAAALGLWSLGSHEALGLGAHVQTEEGVIAVSCTPEGVALRVTNGLFRSPVLGWITDTGSAGGTVAMAPGVAYSEAVGEACALGVPGLAGAGSVVLLDVPVAPKGAGQGFGLDIAGSEVVVASGAEVTARVPGARSVGVEGLAASLGALAASCPALATAMQQPCP